MVKKFAPAIMYSALYEARDAHPFAQCAHKCITAENPGDFIDNEPGFLVLWGGEDISPSIYGAQSHKLTHAGDHPSLRDRLETNLANEAVERGMLVVGICRGAQLMCALSGGKLIQHVSNHQSAHQMFTKDGVQLRTSSLHHQMMWPFDVEHEMIGWSNGLSGYYDGESMTEQLEPPNLKEPEIVWFPKTRCLAIQGHPEYLSPEHPFVVYCNELVKEKF